MLRDVSLPAPQGAGEGFEADGQWTESLSVAMTNQLRAQLGLRPLDASEGDGGPPGASKDEMKWVPAKGVNFLKSFCCFCP